MYWRWNGQFFDKITLKDLGLVFQVGHPPGIACINLRLGPHDFVVVHTNGIHPISIRYCECNHLHEAGDTIQQLLHYELYPATLFDPTTCFIYRVLEHFSMLTLQGKITPYDYYLSLQYLTDNLKLGVSYDCLKSFMHVVREWRHIKMLKCANRGHEPGGVNATKPGELCVRCPACLRPGFNLPDNWSNVSDELKFVYTMVIAINANFRLRRRAVSSDARDPPLGPSWGFFISTCTGLQALSQADRCFSKGLATTGVGMALDGRHGFILPTGVGDLQKGERYCNMDYIIASVLSHYKDFPPLLLSYDIACQWSVHLHERLGQLPAHMKIDLPEGDLHYAIPKYHFNAHKVQGHTQYSLNYMRGAGRTDGEEIEHSMREMGSGSREDILEDHLNYANIRKYVDMDKQKVEAYENDPFLPDPYNREIPGLYTNRFAVAKLMCTTAGMTEADICLQLMEEENRTIQDGDLPLHRVSPANMVIELLEIEDQHTALQTAELFEKQTAIQWHITTIREVQSIYMPVVPLLVARREQDALLHKLDETDLALCSQGLAEIKERLHDAQLHNSLNKLRAQLHVKTRLVAFKNRNVHHQKHCTRTRGQLLINEAKIRAFTEKYHAGWRAKCALAGSGDWQKTWQVLKPEDVRTLYKKDNPINAKAVLYNDGLGSDDEDQDEHIDEELCKQGKKRKQISKSKQQKLPKKKKHISEGQRTTSWIWLGADNTGLMGELEGMAPALCDEFIRAKARHLRHKKECLWLTEEKKRTMESLEHKALLWDVREGQAGNYSTSDIELQGCMAYAAWQAFYRRWLKAKFHTLWTSPKKQSPRKAVAAAELPAGSYDVSDMFNEPVEGLTERGIDKTHVIISKASESEVEDEGSLAGCFEDSDDDLCIQGLEFSDNEDDSQQYTTLV
ncbi:uncharacterized protein PHACADRAFT_29178 [Phanerochaete carnosa HHB-10118-sp]|uniref:CxC2-like cysteine cluster KDZ transposase-associated domain-containing protein n=1 Tax=Phanerochaete carnosa (strain HHB-10118-sp) TaxID=650164 RepID=K5W4K6_PHACS|nr:uncharacterized protein PHACADRAFT_29178 [Phanerochaete carnosa HHB-10118-sp]EKM53869.1 hypothetical protein PHACADRAFT_29178 [Phanerochaete carnosa HHB-10118-sp]